MGSPVKVRKLRMFVQTSYPRFSKSREKAMNSCGARVLFSCTFAGAKGGGVAKEGGGGRPGEAPGTIPWDPPKFFGISIWDSLRLCVFVLFGIL